MVQGGEDPTLRMLRSSLGKQVQSERETSAIWGFGTSGRDAASKIYISREFDKILPGNNSQGPVYKAYASIGPQPESKYQSLPAPGFGSAARSERLDKNGVPGPGAYECDASIGPTLDSRRESAPRTVFGTASRDVYASLPDELLKTVASGRGTPAPGTYSAIPGACGKQIDSRYPSSSSHRAASARRFDSRDTRRDYPAAGAYESAYNSVGRQFLSNKKTVSSTKIGTSNRDAANKIFISKEHEKSAYGMNSPGPAAGVVIAACAPQKLSAKKSYPSWGFGTSARSKGYANDVPGPGSYWA